MAMRRRKIHYTVSGDKERCELGATGGLAVL
jgi:hypothetical protein